MPTGVRAPFPSAAAIERAEKLTREPFLHPGETKTEALAPGTPRRRALDAAIAEAKQGLTVPSLEWRREFSLMLGLERVLSEDEPLLADGTQLNPHQVDALSGTLTALLAQQAAVGAAEAAAAPADMTPDAPRSAPASKNGRAAAADAGKSTRRATTAARSESDEDDEDLEDDFELDEDEDDESDEPEDLDEHEDEPEDFSADDTALDTDVVVDLEDPGADRRFWFEHATGAGKTVAAMGFVEATRTGGVLILTHRRNLVDQFIDEIKTRGYRDRLCPPLLIGQDAANGPVTVETYQWFVRNAGKISDAYTVVICDEAHTALGEKTSAQIRAWDKPVWIGMTATGALIARHVTDLFPTQTSRFDLSQAARRGVIAPLRCIRIPPGPGVRTIAKVPLRRGEVDTEFDQEMLAELLDQTPFNLAIADLYKTRFNGLPGVVYAAGVKHAYNVAESFRALDMKAMAVSGETPKRELARILADYEAGKIDVLVNAQLLAEGWNSPRATVCMHLAPTASKRIYQQRVGRVTRRHPGKEAGIVVDFVHPATKHDDPVVTLHSLLDRDVYRGGAIVVGPVRRGRGRRIRVERRVLPVTPDPTRRAEVFERELWRIAVENLDYAEQHVWAALAGARVQPNGWRRAKAMLHFDRQGELRSRFLITTLQRNKSAQLRLRALQEIAAGKDAEAFDTAIDLMGTWTKDERREGVKIMLLALAERRIGRRDQANAWIWRMAEYTRDVHEEYAAQRWPETKRLLGLLVNSSGSAHARNARRLVHATRTQDRRLSAALLAAALAHTPEAEEALRGARTRMARKPAALARELLRNFPKGKKSSKRRRKTKTGANGQSAAVRAGAGTGTAVIEDTERDTALTDVELDETELDGDDDDVLSTADADDTGPRDGRNGLTDDSDAEDDVDHAAAVRAAAAAVAAAQPRTRRRRTRTRTGATSSNGGEADREPQLLPSSDDEAVSTVASDDEAVSTVAPDEEVVSTAAPDDGESAGSPAPRKRARRTTTKRRVPAGESSAPEAAPADAEPAADAPAPARLTEVADPTPVVDVPEAAPVADAGTAVPVDADAVPAPAARRKRTTATKSASTAEPATTPAKRATTAKPATTTAKRATTAKPATTTAKRATTAKPATTTTKRATTAKRAAASSDEEPVAAPKRTRRRTATPSAGAREETASEVSVNDDVSAVPDAELDRDAA